MAFLPQLSSSVTSLIGAATSLNTAPNKDNLAFPIDQTERLFTTRSRQTYSDKLGGERGQRTFIKLLTSDVTKSFDRHSSEHGESKPTSLGTSKSGVLSDAINGQNKYGGYADFLLTDIRGSFDEKLQVVEVFGDAEIAYYFGRQPIMMQFAGVLIDSPDNNWFVEWVEMYAHVLRGTQLARNYELVRIITPNMEIIGTITHMDWQQNSDRDVDIPFSFTMMAKQIIPLPVVSTGKPLSGNTGINANKAESFKTQADIVSQKTAFSNLQSVIQTPGSTTQDYATALKVTGPLGSGFSSLGTPTLGTQLGSPLNEAFSAGANNVINSSSGGVFANVTSNLAGIRASLFSPVYGVLSSLTKLVKSTSGDSSSIVKSLTSPIRDILRDIRNVSNQAIGVVNLINGSIHNSINNSRALDSDLRATLALLKKTAGVISTAPQTITSNLRDLVNVGKFPATAAFLQNSAKGTTINSVGHTNSKLVLLNSGPKHTPEQGAKL